jgi:hypothetical protein
MGLVRGRFIHSRARESPEMNRYAKVILYGLLALAVFTGISFIIGGRVNWVLAAATAIGVMIAYYAVASRRRW